MRFDAATAQMEYSDRLLLPRCQRASHLTANCLFSSRNRSVYGSTSLKAAVPSLRVTTQPKSQPPLAYSIGTALRTRTSGWVAPRNQFRRVWK